VTISRRWIGITRLLMLVWAALWAGFVLGTTTNEGASALPYAAGSLAVLVGLVIGAWRWPRAAGAAMLLAGAGATWLIQDSMTRATLGIPAVLLGALLFILAFFTPAPISANR